MNDLIPGALAGAHDTLHDLREVSAALEADARECLKTGRRVHLTGHEAETLGALMAHASVVIAGLFAVIDGYRSN